MLMLILLFLLYYLYKKDNKILFMTLIKELQINITMSNYTQRSSSYSINYDYLFLDNLMDSSSADLFRSDLKNLKIKTFDGTECKILYLPKYGSQPAAIVVRIPVGKISETTKLILEVHDTTFSSMLSTGGDLLMFDANSDTYSNFFMEYSGLSINNDSTDNGKFLRARFVPNIDGTSPTSLFSKLKSYCMVVGSKTLVQVSSFDAYSSGTDDEGDWKQYHIHGSLGTGTSKSSDYLEGYSRNNTTKIYQKNYSEVEISPEWYETTDFESYNYIDLKWLLIFPSPLFAANGIPEITVTEKDSKYGIRLFKGEHEYSKAYKGSKLLWDANDETMDNTGLYLPEKIINKDWDWVF